MTYDTRKGTRKYEIHGQVIDYHLLVGREAVLDSALPANRLIQKVVNPYIITISLAANASANYTLPPPAPA